MVHGHHMFRYIDISGTVTYHNQYTVPETLGADDLDFEEAIYASRGNNRIVDIMYSARCFGSLESTRFLP